MVTFSEFAELLEALSSTNKRSIMVQMVAEFLEKLSSEEVEPVCLMLCSRVVPKWGEEKTSIGGSTLWEAIKAASGCSDEELAEFFDRTGDIGSAAQLALEQGKTRLITLAPFDDSVVSVYRVLRKVAVLAGEDSKRRKVVALSSLLSCLSPLEAKYAVRVLAGDLRVGFSEGMLFEALAFLTHLPAPLVRRKSMFLGGVEKAARLVKGEGPDALRKAKPRYFRPIAPMLAQSASSVKEIISSMKKAAFEFKIDGARVQIHKRGEKVAIYSRRLNDVTSSLPEIVRVVQDGIPEDCIVEGEVVAVGEDGKPLPFQYLMRKFRRIREAPIPFSLDLYLFDLLLLGEKSLMDSPYAFRRERLEELTDLKLVEQTVTDDPEEVEAFLDKSIASGHEGLMAKDLSGFYQPGFRSNLWLKLKRTLEPLDLVIVAAQYGYGRRYKWLSDYYLAARDERTGDFLVVGKTFKGLTDAEMTRMTEELEKLAVGRKGRVVFVIPRIVVEVIYNEIQKSSKYRSGYALRFARISRIRWDKRPEEADTIQKIEEIYRKQFETKHKPP